MGSHVADTGPPFNSWLRKTRTVFSGGKLLDSLATFAFLNNLVAGAAVKLTPVLVHKKTLNTFFYACTNHGYHVLSILDKGSHPTRIPWVPRKSTGSNKPQGILVKANEKQKQILCLKQKKLSRKISTHIRYSSLHFKLIYTLSDV
jgi:hypothetical protein